MKESRREERREKGKKIRVDKTWRKERKSEGEREKRDGETVQRYER